MKKLIIPISITLIILIGIFYILIDRRVDENRYVYIYFGNSNLSDYINCSDVFSVERLVSSKNVERESIEQLLLGPNQSELDSGYFTSLPSTKIKSLVIESGVASIDFDSGLDTGVAGSCRVENIRSQIERTLKQFPWINQVVISVDGRTEDILQP